MNAERWQRIQTLFHEAADLPASEQRDYVGSRTADDPALLDEVMTLLEHDADEHPLLDRGLADVAGRLLADARQETPPRDLGPYRLQHVLGEGGMGVVYLAERPDLDRRVAIKLLRDAWLSPARRARFADEQRMLAQLNHPAIARLYDADVLPDGTPWFAMEFVDGVSLTEFCERHALSTRQRLELFRAVCEAVLHAHRHAVIHRDLKPSNILVTADGRPKLLDFGIAKPLDRLDAGDGTHTGMRMMTPTYAAPEQFQGVGLGVHTDIYSLGAILYELLAGRPPFDLRGRTPTQAERIVTEQDPVKPSAAAGSPFGGDAARRGPGRGAWADLDVLCLTAMQKDPARRYRTVESLVRDVDHFLGGEPLDARPDTAGYRLGKFVRRHAVAVGAVATVLAVVVGLVAFYTVRLARARDQAVAGAERTRRIQTFMNGLFEGGDPAAGPSDSLRVVTLLERGVREARSLAGEPDIQTELYLTLGEIYRTLGDFPRADSLLTLALDERRGRWPHDHPDVARSQLALALLRADQSRLEEAERLVREGVATSRIRAGADPAANARAHQALAYVLECQGDYDEAIAVLTEAVRLDTRARLPEAEVALTLTQLANNHFYSGHYAVSDSINRRVLAMDRALYGNRHPHVASDLINLGAVRLELGEYRKAERDYREALDIYRGWYGENHFETAAALTNVGRALIPQGRLDEARDPLRQALAIRERVYGPVHPSVASTLNELALLAQREGRLDEADASFRRMVDIYRVVYDDRHYLVGLALSNLGSLATDRGDLTRAERLFRDALDRYAATLPEGHLYRGITRLKLGRALLRQRRFADAEVETRAGYAIVTRQSEPPARWVEQARRDLLEEYRGLERPEEAARVQAELDAATGGPAAVTRP